MIKKILIILLLIIISLIAIYMQENKNEPILEKEVIKESTVSIKQSKSKMENKITIDYSKNAVIKEEVKMHIINETIYNTNQSMDTHIKTQDIKKFTEKKSKDDLSIDTDVDFNKEEKSIDGMKIKLEKRF